MRDEAVEQMVAPSCDQGLAPPEAIERHDHAVEQQESEEHQRYEHPTGWFDRQVDRQGADGEGVPDREPSTSADEERGRPEVEREEREARTGEPQGDGREAVLAGEGRQGEHADRADGTEDRREPLGVAEAVGRGRGDRNDDEAEQRVEHAVPRSAPGSFR